MKIVIEIDDETYNYAKNYDKANVLGLNIIRKVMKSVADGKVLPKGHGRLIDADAVNKKMKECKGNLQDDWVMWESSAISKALDMYAPTIIEADVTDLTTLFTSKEGKMKIKFTTDFAGNWKAGEIVEAEFYPNSKTLVDNAALIDTKVLSEHCVVITEGEE